MILPSPLALPRVPAEPSRKASALLAAGIIAMLAGCASHRPTVPVSGTLTIVGTTRFAALGVTLPVHIIMRGPTPSRSQRVVVTGPHGSFRTRLAPGTYSAWWSSGRDTTLAVGRFRVARGGRSALRLFISLR